MNYPRIFHKPLFWLKPKGKARFLLPKPLRFTRTRSALKTKKKQAANFRHIEEESNKYAANRITQRVDKQLVVVNAPYPPMNETELDHSFDLPYTRLPAPQI